MIKFSSQMDEAVWNEFKALAEETHRSLSGMLVDAIRQYLQRQRVRPQVMEHLQDSMQHNERLGRLLAE